ncbi:hypothetical protein BsWGS_00906 [Bradybaena similaris]
MSSNSQAMVTVLAFRWLTNRTSVLCQQAGSRLRSIGRHSWDRCWCYKVCALLGISPRIEIIVWFLAWETKLEHLWNNPCTKKVIFPSILYFINGTVPFTNSVPNCFHFCQKGCKDPFHVLDALGRLF